MAFRRLFFAAILTFSATAAHAACGPFPSNQYLGNYSHDQVKAYVEKAHGGDWTPYLVQLQANLDRLQKLRNSDGPKMLRVRGASVEVSKVTFDQFVFQSQQFLAVSRCLAEEQNLQALAEFSTAAGGNVTSPSAGMAIPTQPQQVQFDTDSKTVVRSDQVAGIANPINLQITTKCIDGNTEFDVTNVGTSWPSTGVISIFRIDGPNRQMVSARRLGMEAGENKTFKIGKGKNMTGTLGIAVEPSWYSRDFAMDATASCK